MNHTIGRSPEADEVKSGMTRAMVAVAVVLLAFWALPAGLAIQGDPPDLDGKRQPVLEPEREPVDQLRIGGLRNRRTHAVLPQRLTIHFPRFVEDLNPSSLELWIDGREYTDSLRFWAEEAWIDLPDGFWNRGEHVVLARMAKADGQYMEALYRFLYYPPLPFFMYQWPFDYSGNEPNVVANLMEDYQSFNNKPDAEAYWHLGLDIRAPANSMVHAVIGGTVASINQYKNSDLNWSIVIRGQDGYLWQYNHINVNTIQVSPCQQVQKGAPLGQIAVWPNQYDINGQDYHHLHLNVALWTGTCQDPCLNACAWPITYADGYEYYNPLLFLPNADNVAPRGFGRIYFKPNDSIEAFAFAETVNQAVVPELQGDVDMVAQLQDRRPGVAANMIPGQPYEVGIYDLAYSVVPINPVCGVGYVPRTRLVRFDQIPGGATIQGQDALLAQVYQQRLQYGGQEFRSIFDWDALMPEKQILYYNLTNTHLGQINAAQGYWNTDRVSILGPHFPDGSYQVKVYATDLAGNETLLSALVSLENGLSFSGFCPNIIFALISKADLILKPREGVAARFRPPRIPIRFPEMMEGSARAEIDSRTWPAWYFDLPERRIRVAVGILRGRTVQVEYLPLLGDVIFDIDAEVQILPLGDGMEFDATLPQRRPLRLRMSTRLARDPFTGAPLIGMPHRLNETEFKLVIAKTMDVQGVEMLLTTAGSMGMDAAWQIGAAK
ncbi:MAG: M23 family metallopeptidase [Acidobacteria bacterium]|nr:M23 family metallopeptidase [Acidobacteriota bacterium]